MVPDERLFDLHLGLCHTKGEGAARQGSPFNHPDRNRVGDKRLVRVISHTSCVGQGLIGSWLRHAWGFYRSSTPPGLDRTHGWQSSRKGLNENPGSGVPFLPGAYTVGGHNPLEGTELFSCPSGNDSPV